MNGAQFGPDQGPDNLAAEGQGQTGQVALDLPLDADEMVARWLMDIITPALAAVGLGTIKVWTDEVPARKASDAIGTDSRFPAVLVKLHDTSDRQGASAKRTATWAEYQVTIINVGLSFAPMSPVKAVIDQAIEVAMSGLTRDGRHYVSKAYRRTPVRYPERSAATGCRYNHQGGIYRLMHYQMPEGN